MKRFALAFCLCASSGFADEAEDLFVEANLIGIFYHEMGHALIDVMQMPVFGQEEDAADVASVLLVNALFEPEIALDLAYDVSAGFWAEAVARADGGWDVAFWDVHGPDEQRFYNTVCLFYGADPDNRDDFAVDMDLPEERADYCEDEYNLAADSWGGVFEELLSDQGSTLDIQLTGDTLTDRITKGEVDIVNEFFSFPDQIVVRVEPCGEANAFYDPQYREIIMCTEFEDHLREIYRAIQG